MPDTWPEQRQRLEELVGLRRFAQPGDLTADIRAALARLDASEADRVRLRVALQGCVDVLGLLQRYDEVQEAAYIAARQALEAQP